MSLPPPPPPPSNPPPGPGGLPPTSPPPGVASPPLAGYALIGNEQRGDLAGFGIRLVAYLLDGILYGLLSLMFIIPGGLMIANAFGDCTLIEYTDGTNEIRCDEGELKVGLLVGGIALIVVGFIVLFVIYIRALARTGQTWGKKIAGVRVIRQDTGGPIGYGKAFGRQLFALVISAQILYIGYLWMLWDDRKQTLHDKVVGSIVVRA